MVLRSWLAFTIGRDTEPTAIRDLGSNFYLTEDHAKAGTLRATACLPQVRASFSISVWNATVGSAC